MYKYFIFILCFVYWSVQINGQTILTPFERSNGKQTATYDEIIDFYKQLSNKFSSVQIMQDAPLSADAQYPLSTVIFNGKHLGNDTVVTILINNGIHAGEPDGIDACMMLMRDAATGKVKIPDNIVLVVIPVFNIGGVLNRTNYSRANQAGPESYGFRGNWQNLDLNRDFIKLDAPETHSLESIFHIFKTDIFIDNHVSDGADYQHIMTLLATQHDKLGGETGAFMNDVFVPLVYKDMKKRGYDLVPYVNDFRTTPDNGWTEFYDPPRFSSGYAALSHIMAFVPETHMLKPFDQRVKATYELMCSFINIASVHAKEIKSARKNDIKTTLGQLEFPLSWKVDTSKFAMINFKGYEAGYKASNVSGMLRLYYDHKKPFTKQVPFYNYFVPDKMVTAPQYYVIQQGWKEVISRLSVNHVKFVQMQNDTTITLSVYRIEKYETQNHPYEKHYQHYNVSVTKHTETIHLIKGDYLIPTQQEAKRYLVETLEPTGPDGFFAWNFFDAILQEKEYYSDYVFEDVAAQMLEKNADLRKLLDDQKLKDTVFAKDGRAQLDFVYRHSPYYEPEHMRYPIFRID